MGKVRDHTFVEFYALFSLKLIQFAIKTLFFLFLFVFRVKWCIEFQLYFCIYNKIYWIGNPIVPPKRK